MPKFFQAAWRAQADRNDFQYGGKNKETLEGCRLCLAHMQYV